MLKWLKNCFKAICLYHDYKVFPGYSTRLDAEMAQRIAIQGEAMALLEIRKELNKIDAFNITITLKAKNFPNMCKYGNPKPCEIFGMNVIWEEDKP
jgi:hypothetical protein